MREKTSPLPLSFPFPLAAALTLVLSELCGHRPPSPSNFFCRHGDNYTCILKFVKPTNYWQQLHKSSMWQNVTNQIVFHWKTLWCCAFGNVDKVLFIQQLRKTYLADIQALISLGGNPDLIQEETSLWHPIKTPIKTFHSGPQRKTPLSSSRSDITVSWIMSVDVLDLVLYNIKKEAAA